MSKKTAYRKFAEMMLHKDSTVIPKILKSMTNAAQAELLASLPGTAVQMAQNIDRAVDDIRGDLNDLFHNELGGRQCAIGCPEKAIHMIEVREPDFIAE